MMESIQPATKQDLSTWHESHTIPVTGSQLPPPAASTAYLHPDIIALSFVLMAQPDPSQSLLSSTTVGQSIKHLANMLL